MIEEEPESVVANEVIDTANQWLISYLQNTLNESSREVLRLRDRLNVTFRLLIIGSGLMFLI